MPQAVEITFECLPLRSATRNDPPLDASPAFQALCGRMVQAAEKHGRHNSYYPHDARCTFRSTNRTDTGMLQFRFEGTVLTDSEDQRTEGADLSVELAGDTCDWLTTPVVEWFAETVRQAVRIEFDRFIAAGDLERTIERVRLVEAESDQHGGFIGQGL